MATARLAANVSWVSVVRALYRYDAKTAAPPPATAGPFVDVAVEALAVNVDPRTDTALDRAGSASIAPA